jgi:hypothetical protein
LRDLPAAIEMLRRVSPAVGAHSLAIGRLRSQERAHTVRQRLRVVLCDDDAGVGFTDDASAFAVECGQDGAADGQ